MVSNTSRPGLFLEWLHADDTTLDDVISYISPSDAGGKLYHDTESFTSKFIKGAPSGGSSDVYTGDEASLTFVANYLDCLYSYEGTTFVTPNGSILFDYDANFTIPLDPDKKDSADFFKIVESNTYVESSVKSGTGAIGGGTSYSSDNPCSGQSVQETAALAMAAKQGAADEHGDGAAEAAGVDGGVGETAVTAETAETAETAGVPACVDAGRNAVLDQGGGVNRIR